MSKNPKILPRGIILTIYQARLNLPARLYREFGIKVDVIVAAGIVGALMGLCWLLPVYKSPSHGTVSFEGVDIWRILRFVSPLSVFLFIPQRVSKQQLLSPLTIGYFFVYFVIPILCTIISPFDRYIFFGVFPTLISGLLVAMVFVIPTKRVEAIVIGIGLAATTLISLRVLTYGVEFSTYYLRERAHFGFNHPIVSGSAIVASLISIALLIRNFQFYRTLKQKIACFAIAGLGAAALYVADSRNTTSLIFVSAMVYAIYPAIQKRVWLRMSFVGLLAFFPLFLTTLSVLPQLTSAGANFFYRVNFWTSGRLESNGEFFVQMFSGSGGNLWGPSSEITQMLGEYLRGFAGGDSVFLSYVNLYGFVPGLFLLLVWMVHGLAGFTSPENRLPTALWAGAIWFFCFDAQGFTSSNLIILLLMGMSAARCAGAVSLVRRKPSR